MKTVALMFVIAVVMPLFVLFLLLQGQGAW